MQKIKSFKNIEVLCKDWIPASDLRKKFDLSNSEFSHMMGFIKKLTEDFIVKSGAGYRKRGLMLKAL